MKKYVEANEKASVRKCRQVLAELNADIETKLKKGLYAKAGGFQIYRKDVNTLQNLYTKRKQLGVKVKIP